MKELARKFEDLFIDITFAEEREVRSGGEALKRFFRNTEDTLAAVAFAEAGEFEAAARQINKDYGATGPHCPWYPQRRFNRICTGGA